MNDYPSMDEVMLVEDTSLKCRACVFVDGSYCHCPPGQRMCGVDKHYVRKLEEMAYITPAWKEPNIPVPPAPQEEKPRVRCNNRSDKCLSTGCAHKHDHHPRKLCFTGSGCPLGRSGCYCVPIKPPQPKEIPVKKDRRTRAVLIEHLNMANVELHLEKQAHKADIDIKNEEIDELTRQLKRVNEDRDKWYDLHGKQSQEAQAQLGELSNQVATKHAQVIKYSNELESLKYELSNARKENARLEQSHSLIENQNHHLRKDLDSLKTTINSCMTIIKEAMR